MDVLNFYDSVISVVCDGDTYWKGMCMHGVRSMTPFNITAILSVGISLDDGAEKESDILTVFGIHLKEASCTSYVL